ncbi:MAG: HindIII family type II restriction endonuclease [Anaerolineae bacterium]|nr:HindIII family type II restriction endonuclease [Anaerolineae bacterium]
MSRGDSADVRGASDKYTIVGDAKAFRLSRTAKNQKDFKITALDDWRRSDTFACLVSPLYQFPSRSSQIYEQAKSKNVTLLSYAHLKFFIQYTDPKTDLTPLWTLAQKLEPTKDARSYWEALDDVTVELTNQSYQILKTYLRDSGTYVSQIAQEGIKYWQNVISEYRTLTKEEAIERLIRAERLDSKIVQIKATLARAKNLHG